MSEDQAQKIRKFHQLHSDGCFIMPNPWDIGTTMFLEQVGFQALATTSAGLAFAHGSPDKVGALTLEMTLSNIEQIVSSTPLPVNADFQNGFTDDVEQLGVNVKKCVQTGVAGLSIEDATGNNHLPLYEKYIAVERIRAARSAIDSTGLNVLLTARCEAWLVGDDVPLKTSLDRLVAFAEAGADCLFAPGVRDIKEIGEIVKAVSPKPVNILVSSPSPDLNLKNLTSLGVRRISIGSALARTAWGSILKASRNIFETGSFDELGKAASFSELNSIFYGG